MPRAEAALSTRRRLRLATGFPVRTRAAVRTSTSPAPASKQDCFRIIGSSGRMGIRSVSHQKGLVPDSPPPCDFPRLAAYPRRWGHKHPAKRRATTALMSKVVEMATNERTRIRGQAGLRDRIAEKQASRAADAHALATGEVTREQLNHENRFLPAQGSVVRLDLARPPK